MLVSAIMPTCDRPRWVPLAVACFLGQDWPEKELIVLDDGRKLIDPILPRNVNIRSWYSPKKMVLGEKLNWLCTNARGDVVIRWDDDDWYAVDRISSQVRQLEESRAQMAGYHRFFYFDVIAGRAFEYKYTGTGDYASGSTQCFLRSWWQAHHFPVKNIGEDSEYSRIARDCGALKSFPSDGKMVARVHSGNTSMQARLFTGNRSFRAVEMGNLPVEFLRVSGLLEGPQRSAQSAHLCATLRLGL